MAQRIHCSRTGIVYSRLRCSPCGVPISRSKPGSLKYGSGTRISDWMETKTCNIVEFDGSQLSAFSPLQVPRSERQTFPESYKFGLKVTVLFPVVKSCTLGASWG